MGNNQTSKNKKEKLENDEKQINKFVYIKSKYILKQIFDNLSKSKSLNIIKYNKNIQNKLEISLNDYKEWNTLYSSIIINIIPKKNKYGKFIDILNKDNKKYYHAYFNDNKDEISKLYIYKTAKVNKIKIIINYQIESFVNLFSECECIESISFQQFNRINITDMSYMFNKCSYLKNIDLSKFNTIQVKRMENMFNGCSLLKKLDLSKFTTDNVENMKNMFSDCKSLSNINIKSFNTSKVSNMAYMFDNCFSLVQLDLSNFDTTNVIDMSYMFNECKELTKLNISNFNIDKTRDMNYMAYNCYKLKHIDISNFKFNSGKNYMGMFLGCSKELEKEIREQNNTISDDAFEDDNFSM